MNNPSERYVCTPLRTQLPVVSNADFIRTWMTRRAAAAKAMASTETGVVTATPAALAAAAPGRACR